MIVIAFAVGVVSIITLGCLAVSLIIERHQHHDAFREIAQIIEADDCPCDADWQCGRWACRVHKIAKSSA